MPQNIPHFILPFPFPATIIKTYKDWRIQLLNMRRVFGTCNVHYPHSNVIFVFMRILQPNIVMHHGWMVCIIYWGNYCELNGWNKGHDALLVMLPLICHEHPYFIAWWSPCIIDRSPYYRRFINHFADIARPLHNLTCKAAPWNWTTACQKSL